MSQVIAGAAGAAVVLAAWLSALRAVFTPRDKSSYAARWVARLASRAFLAAATPLPHRQQDRWLDLCAPACLFLLAGIWLAGQVLGFGLLAWATSGISLSPDGLVDFFQLRDGSRPLALVAWTSAALLLVAFTTHLVRFTGAYSRRERPVARLAGQAEQPPDADMLLAEYARTGSRDCLDSVFAEWAGWMADVRCTHVGYPALIFARPASELCWVNAAVIVLDAAALAHVIAPSWAPPHTRVLLTTGSRCLRRLSEQLGTRPLQVPISLQGREERDFAESMRLAVDAGLVPERDEDECRAAFQVQRTRYAPHAARIAAHLRYDFTAETHPDAREGRMHGLRSEEGHDD